MEPFLYAGGCTSVLHSRTNDDVVLSRTDSSAMCFLYFMNDVIVSAVFLRRGRAPSSRTHCYLQHKSSKRYFYRKNGEEQTK